MGGDELGRRALVAGGDGMADGLGDLPLTSQPRRRAPVQLGRRPGLLDLQPRAQEVGEQRVVAVPAPVAVERDDEQVAAIELGEADAGPLAADHRVAQRPGHALEDRGAHQEAALLGGDAVEDLGGQVVADLAVVAGQRGAEVLARRMLAQRQPRELQPRGPALGALLDLRDLLGRELDAERREVRAGLVLAEAHLTAADLDELVAGAQARQQRPGRVGARRHGEVDRGRQALDEGDERAVDVLAGHGVQVVEDEDHAAGELAELVDEQRHDDLLEAHAGRAQSALGAGADPGRHRAQGLDDARPEAHGIVVARLQGQPCERLDGRRGQMPLLQQGGLARPGGCRQHGQARVLGAGDQGHQRATGDQAVAARWDLELRGGDDAHTAVRPPSTVHTAPVTYDASSEARKATTAAISSARAARPSGMGASTSARACGSSVHQRFIGVSVIPG